MPYSSESRRIRRSQWGGFGHESSTVDDNLTIIRRGSLYRFSTGYDDYLANPLISNLQSLYDLHDRYRATPRTSGLSGHRSPLYLPQLAAADYVVLRYVELPNSLPRMHARCSRPAPPTISTRLVADRQEMNK